IVEHRPGTHNFLVTPLVIHGNQVARVDVNITTARDTNMIWSFGTQDQGESWYFALIDSYADVNHNIIIKGTITAQMPGYYAIDDIDIRELL
ncbi:unnamed protein product, partial [Rotaria sp. Silwood2]